MTDDEQDLALQTLIATRPTVAPDLDSGLLQQCYAIQKKYQFSEERAASHGAMERLIDAKVAQMSGKA